MKLAQTNLSNPAENRPAVAQRLDCGVFSAAIPRLRPSRRAQSGDESPQSRRFAPFAVANAFVAHGVSLTPRLQPGVSRSARIENRFNGFLPRAEAVETAGDFSAKAFHRAEAAVLMRTAAAARNFRIADAVEI